MSAPLGIQLYTLREEAAGGLAPVLDRLGRIGFGCVEVATLHDLSAAALRRCAEDAGMHVATLHGVPFDDAADGIFDTALALGAGAVVIPAAGPPEFETGESVSRLADRLNTAGELAAARGLELGYHNHFWEWNELADGTSAYERLVEQLSPRVGLEVDVYWAQTAGRDPAELLATLGPRARWVHLKDGPADVPESAMTAAGEGRVDLAAAMAAAPAGAQAFLELDRCDADMWTAVETSFSYLTTRGIVPAR